MIDILNSDSDSSDFISSTKIVVSDLKRLILAMQISSFSLFSTITTSELFRILEEY